MARLAEKNISETSMAKPGKAMDERCADPPTLRNHFFRRYLQEWGTLDDFMVS
jgi:hypothetical protein